MRKEIIQSDFDVLLRSAATHPSAKYIASVAEVTSWCRLWDLPLDRGILGTRGLQTLLKVLSHRIYENSLCPSCGASLGTDSLWVDHICLAHSEVVNHLSCHDIISKLKEADMDTIHTHTHTRDYCNPRCACAARVIVVVVCVCMYVCVCDVCVCVTTHNCRLTHWNHKTEIPTCSQQYSDRFKFCRFS